MSNEDRFAIPTFSALHLLTVGGFTLTGHIAIAGADHVEFTVWQAPNKYDKLYVVTDKPAGQTYVLRRLTRDEVEITIRDSHVIHRDREGQDGTSENAGPKEMPSAL